MVTGPGSFGQMIATHPEVDKVGFTGSTQVRKTCQTGLSLLKHTPSPSLSPSLSLPLSLSLSLSLSLLGGSEVA